MSGTESQTPQGILRQSLSLVLSALLLATPMSGVLGAADDSSIAVGAVLTVASDPAGARVYVDGRLIGETPLRADRLAGGDHRVRVVKAGYLENGRIINVSAGRTTTIAVKLTRNVSASSSTQVITTTDDDGGVPKWVWYAVAGGGAAVAAALILGANKAPVAGNISASPATALQGGTTVTLTSQGASDPDGDPLTYSWEFGDGTTGSGPSATKVYGSAGTFTVTLRVSDGKKDASTTTTVTVRNLSATWFGSVGTFFTATMTLSQSGNSISGSYSDSDGFAAGVTGTVQTNSPRVRLSINYDPSFIGRFTLDPNPDVNSLTGSYEEPNFAPTTTTLTRQ